MAVAHEEEVVHAPRWGTLPASLECPGPSLGTRTRANEAAGVQSVSDSLRNSAKSAGWAWTSSNRPPLDSARSRASARPRPVPVPC